MDEHTSHEQAYKNGYDKGYAAGVADSRKSKKCAVCKELSKLYDGSIELITAYYLIRKKENPTYLMTHGNRRPESVNTTVHFCPWCGRNLRGEDDD